MPFLLFSPGWTQEEAKKPEQIALKKGETKFLFKEEPYFLYQFRKGKKFKAIREKWAFVDLPAREKILRERLDKCRNSSY